MRWRAFYADGRRYASADGDWRDLPTHGLVIAVWWDEHGQRHLDCGADALIHIGDAIVSVNLPTPAFEHAAYQERGAGRLKLGACMEPDAWALIRAEADRAVIVPER